MNSWLSMTQHWYHSRTVYWLPYTPRRAQGVTALPPVCPSVCSLYVSIYYKCFRPPFDLSQASSQSKTPSPQSTFPGVRDESLFPYLVRHNLVFYPNTSILLDKHDSEVTRRIFYYNAVDAAMPSLVDSATGSVALTPSAFWAGA